MKFYRQWKAGKAVEKGMIDLIAGVDDMDLNDLYNMRGWLIGVVTSGEAESLRVKLWRLIDNLIVYHEAKNGSDRQVTR